MITHIKTTKKILVNIGAAEEVLDFVEGRLGSNSFFNNFMNFGTNFNYLAVENNEVVRTTKPAFERTEDEINTMYDSLKPLINPLDKYTDQLRTLYYNGFRYEMLKTFSPKNPTLTIDDIVLVDEEGNVI